jgi:serine/threonine-protein kinase
MKKMLSKMASGLGGMLGAPVQSAVEQPLASEHNRLILGNYELGRKLGDGSMGAVYHAINRITGREVAVKTMALSEKFDEDGKSRFFREAEIIERMDHPNIVAVYEVGEEDGLAYISMELLKGSNLEPHTQPANLLPVAVVLNIVARVADALDYAHRQSVVHRDVKPDNIMYDPVSGDIKVMDFSVSRITTESKTKLGVVLGTPYYMSPEQLKGMKIGPSSDLFSLGISLYQLLAGKRPFEGVTPMGVMSSIANEPHPDILTLRPGLPAALGKIIDRALAKEISQRFQTGEEMADAILRCLARL